MNEKTFLKPEATIIHFGEEDIITESTGVIGSIPLGSIPFDEE